MIKILTNQKDIKIMKAIQMLMVVAAIFSFSGILSAGEMLDIKGSFGAELKDGAPEDWYPNKPGWDAAGTLAMNKIPDTGKYALQVTSQTKAMYLYGKQWPVGSGEKCVIKGMVKGKGKGSLGMYTYPGGGYLRKEFSATEDWTEFTAEIIIPEKNPKIEKISFVISVSSGSSIEFLDVTAEIVKKQE